MEPGYTSGEPVLIQKWNVPDCLHTNDVIVIHREDLDRDIVKRVVALPEIPSGSQTAFCMSTVCLNKTQHSFLSWKMPAQLPLTFS